MHLKGILEQMYEISAHWTGTKYVSLMLEWDYYKQAVHLTMPGYVQKAFKLKTTAIPNLPMTMTHPHLLRKQ